MNEDTPISRQLFSIPNLMGYFRIILIPFIVWRYVTAETITDYYIAAVIIGISGITDFLDGFVARKFHMITKVGKALDPIADKLTQGAIVIALSFRFPAMTALIVLLVVKEGFMGIMGLIMLRRGKMLDGAKWFGKVSTAVLYVVMFLLILVPQIPMKAANGLILLCGALLLFSFISYIPVFWKMAQDS
ncbi:CDP-alcohol phosphatidyltransferase family protein [Faecalicatena sp. AGMB00832]|uniref:CDP-diacylglycerol--glycerol-3-phosphate 3-phosphatidyltransferase n=1 Tax=Faecalicatena faecalis TaxID=2726362 RepID=A0ABS6D6N1_9FIRM|nr:MULTISPECIES: CDP-alcohol phosphatidyltransferase family protein [Faecalicatena]MBU3877101.1 CDP-alcohol phosphatidyltransferase family protein [Faecalicatena faecalis]MCI6467106.1 CDP-alcohol phosphatidyltransferase family protein [Faecalicatena sp.]MDY5618890.1 CDP-alcohol phosphatidyltransferase family protein [Lachnospiraceae bacterium]